MDSVAKTVAQGREISSNDDLPQSVGGGDKPRLKRFTGRVTVLLP
jgi:hypothetical protein